jgi:hypothetical protein
LAWNVDDGEAPAFFWEGLEIRRVERDRWNRWVSLSIWVLPVRPSQMSSMVSLDVDAH